MSLKKLKLDLTKKIKIKMKNFVILLIFSFFHITKIKVYSQDTTESYPNQLTLQSPDKFKLFWKYDHENITFELHVKNAAWFLFGIKGVLYSNVVLASMYTDGTGHFSERILTNNNNSLTINPNLKWLLLDAFQTTNNFTVIKFYRNIKLQCGQNPRIDSLDIQPGLNTLVFSTGDSFNDVEKTVKIDYLNTTEVNLLISSPRSSQFNCVVPPQIPIFNSTPTGLYSNSMDLIPGVYRFYWNVTNTTIIGEIHCRTSGWIGFGISPNGGMNGSNVIIGWINLDGSVNFTDRYIVGTNVIKTKNQSVVLLSSGQKNGYTYFKFQRNINLCDSQHLSIQVLRHILEEFAFII